MFVPSLFFLLFCFVQSSFIECDLCKAGIWTIQEALKFNKTDSEVEKIATEFCIDAKIEKPIVCENLVQIYKQQFLTIFELQVFNPSDFCGFIGACTDTPHPFTPPSFPKPKPPYVPPSPSRPDDEYYYMMHFTDIHYDQLYAPQANADCGEPQCCRKADGPGDSGYWGDYRCDIPLYYVKALAESVKEDFARGSPKKIPNIKYVMWTGDNPNHAVWMYSKEKVFNHAKVLTEFINETAIALGATALPIPGNHDTNPINDFDIPGKWNWLYGSMAQNWQKWLDPEQLATLTYGGWYTKVIEPGLRMIVMNNMYCYRCNFYLYQYRNISDLGGQFTWLINTLQAAEDAGEKVQIVSHIPTHTWDCMINYAQYFEYIVDRYENTITNQFYAHTHQDEFYVFYDVKTGTRPISTGYISPSVTTYTDQNPAYRIYEVNARTKYVTNIFAFTNNIGEMNKIGSKAVPKWSYEYDAKSEYGMDDLFPSSWNTLIKKMSVPNSPLFNSYMKNRKGGNFNSSCTGECQHSELCAVSSSNYEKYMQCKGH